ncbi:MAG: hypothetical protein V4714_04315, partial [Bacteroidota bacterium]
VQQCTDLALQHYPNSIQALLVKAQALQAQYQHENRPSQKQALKATLTEVCRQIAATGYEEMPTSVYWEWLTSAGKEKYRNATVPGQPSERNPFTGEPILTLSQGKYPEMHLSKSRVQIGNMVYNVTKGRIERFVQPDTTEWAISAEVAARFLSVDPLTKSYPELTPYQFAGNTPIQAIDLDGLEPEYVINKIGKLTKPLIALLSTAFNYNKEVLSRSEWIKEKGLMREEFHYAELNDFFPDEIKYDPEFSSYSKVDQRRFSEAKLKGESYERTNDPWFDEFYSWAELISHEEQHRQDRDRLGFFGMVLLGEGRAEGRAEYFGDGAEYVGVTGPKSSSLAGQLFGSNKNILGILKDTRMSEQEKIDRLTLIGLEFRFNLLNKNETMPGKTSAFETEERTAYMQNRNNQIKSIKSSIDVYKKKVDSYGKK